MTSPSAKLWNQSPSSTGRAMSHFLAMIFSEGLLTDLLWSELSDSVSRSMAFWDSAAVLQHKRRIMEEDMTLSTPISQPPMMLLPQTAAEAASPLLARRWCASGKIRKTATATSTPLAAAFMKGMNLCIFSSAPGHEFTTKRMPSKVGNMTRMPASITSPERSMLPDAVTLLQSDSLTWAVVG